MKLGYCRVSTESQCLDRQIDELERYGVDRLYQEKMSGSKADRPELMKLMESLRVGDTVVVDALSRLGRSTKDLLELLERFAGMGVQFVSLHEQIDTTTPTGKLLLTVLVALSEFERGIIIERTRQGLEAARARGRVGGRKPLDQRKVDQAIRLYMSKNHSLREIKELTGVSPSTLYRRMGAMKSVKELNV
jgi:DNA invertase Pin-like site-specific DNA recombinase